MPHRDHGRVGQLTQRDAMGTGRRPSYVQGANRGFLAGKLATGLVPATATCWRAFSTLPPALWVLASTLLAATIIHQG